ncbi:probable ATP-dependent RNA helicase DHX40 [Onychomys torridus]|uniref:probable ATP-dependent RNA helicase DHX40 n=1 Tax=Onychomys torridus TaxID=38674 RepID=UPI00167FC02A|nr:probable ATP-dependent RNA helicase DHX40 [Onychomys torridus]
MSSHFCGGTWQWAGRLWGWGFGAPWSAGPCASKRPPPRHRAAPPPRAASRTRGSKHSYVIRARPRLSPPISSARWTCSPPLRTGSMSRFPAVAGRAPRRQEEGERPRELQEERPSAVRIADREEKGCTSQEGGTTPTFPIQKQRKKLIQAVRDNSFLIVTGNTGSGKTTQLPKYLYEAGFSQHGMIGVTQPRKVAAISVAQRVAEEMKCTLGSKVGYQVRFDDCSSKETAIKYMTDGCLLKHILGDPNLNKFSVIILDEAHERTLTTDILFGLLKKLFQDKSPNRKEHLKVVVMSATMELAKLSAFFGNCPIFDIPGRLYPVREKFCNLIGPRDRENTAYIQAIVKVTMDIHLNEMAGDILVFLTDNRYTECRAHEEVHDDRAIQLRNTKTTGQRRQLKKKDETLRENVPRKRCWTGLLNVPHSRGTAPVLSLALLEFSQLPELRASPTVLAPLRSSRVSLWQSNDRERHEESDLAFRRSGVASRLRRRHVAVGGTPLGVGLRGPLERGPVRVQAAAATSSSRSSSPSCQSHARK